jgi:hypothetical protein
LQVGGVFNKTIPQGAATTVHCVVAAQEEQRGELRAPLSAVDIKIYPRRE